MYRWLSHPKSWQRHLRRRQEGSHRSASTCVALKFKRTPTKTTPGVFQWYPAGGVNWEQFLFCARHKRNREARFGVWWLWYDFCGGWIGGVRGRGPKGSQTARLKWRKWREWGGVEWETKKRNNAPFCTGYPLKWSALSLLEFIKNWRDCPWWNFGVKSFFYWSCLLERSTVGIIKIN